MPGQHRRQLRIFEATHAAPKYAGQDKAIPAPYPLRVMLLEYLGWGEAAQVHPPQPAPHPQGRIPPTTLARLLPGPGSGVLGVRPALIDHMNPAPGVRRLIP